VDVLFFHPAEKPSRLRTFRVGLALFAPFAPSDAPRSYQEAQFFFDEITPHKGCDSLSAMFRAPFPPVIVFAGRCFV